jgi:hypothetical protein
MRVPRFFVKFLRRRLLEFAHKNPPDEMIGPGVRVRKRDYIGRFDEMPEPPKMFLKRWFLIPKNPILNVYLHHFVADDEDRALHDHPWFNMSLLLAGQYIEHTIASGGVHKRHVYRAGDLKFRAPWSAHRVELTKGPLHHSQDWDEWRCLVRNPALKLTTWSLFITGWRMHHWGFHCPGEWVTNEKFAKDGGCGTQDYRALKEYVRD